MTVFQIFCKILSNFSPNLKKKKRSPWFLLGLDFIILQVLLSNVLEINYLKKNLKEILKNVEKIFFNFVKIYRNLLKLFSTPTEFHQIIKYF